MFRFPKYFKLNLFMIYLCINLKYPAIMTHCMRPPDRKI